MKPLIPCAAMTCLLGTLACSGESPVGPSVNERPLHARGAPLTVMSQNMYVGADLDALIGALLGGGDPGLALTLAVGELLANNLELRIAGMADQILLQRPQVIALQEVSAIRVELPVPPFPFPTPVSIAQDFLAQLLEALAARGLHYQVAAANENFTIDLTAVFGVPVRLTDREVLLVSPDIQVRSASNGTFPCPLCMPLGLFTIQRGWVRADIRVASKDMTIVATHPESGTGDAVTQLRTAQIGALIDMLASAGDPVVLLGDLNDRPRQPDVRRAAAGGVS